MSTSLNLAIARANLVLYGGYDFEPDILKMINATNNSFTKIAVSELAVTTPQQFEDDGKQVNDLQVFHTARSCIKSQIPKRQNGNLYPENKIDPR